MERGSNIDAACGQLRAKYEKKYDIEKKENSIVQDTLKNPPNYKNKWVITNPPYLAKNKAKDKSIFIQYDTDDLYKASLLSVLEAEGGILIIPTNFLTDERTGAVRTQFLNQFEIRYLNYLYFLFEVIEFLYTYQQSFRCQ